MPCIGNSQQYHQKRSGTDTHHTLLTLPTVSPEGFQQSQDNCYRQAEHAIDRGVDVVLGSPNDELRAALSDRFPEATIWTPSLDWQTLEQHGTQLSRLVMADRNIVMLASLQEDDDEYVETAIWGEDATSELLVLCRELIGSQLDAMATSDDAPEPPL